MGDEPSERRARRVALALIEEHHVARGVPSVLEMRDIAAAMTARPDTGARPEELAHDVLIELGWRVEMAGGAIYAMTR